MFIDSHDIGKIPGIGFKTAQKIREHVLERPAGFDAGLVYGGTRESICVKDVRMFEGMGPRLLQNILDGPGVPKDLPEKVWGLINGVDDTEVTKAREVPQQISIVSGSYIEHLMPLLRMCHSQEDSYIRLDGLSEVVRELKMLSISLIQRMRLDLTTYSDTEDEEGALEGREKSTGQRTDRTLSRQWLAHPESLRLSTRPRPPLNPDGTRSRTFARMSKSAPMPFFVFNLTLSVDFLAQRIVDEALMPLFRKLHPEKSGWNLSLINVCATSMAMTASNGSTSIGRDIGQMFRKQDTRLKDWRVADVDVPPENNHRSSADAVNSISRQDINLAAELTQTSNGGSEDHLPLTQTSLQAEDGWESGEDGEDFTDSCNICGATMPTFAMAAHARFHEAPD